MLIDETISVFASPGTPTSKAMPAGEDGGEDLIDDVALADDDLRKFFHHLAAGFGELFQYFGDAVGH